MSKSTNEMITELQAIIGEMERVSSENKRNMNYICRITSDASETITKLVSTLKYMESTADTIILPPLVVIGVVQDKYKIQINTRSRKKEYVNARHIACYLLKKFTRMTLTDIADFVGIIDHTTVLYAITNVKKFMSLEPKYVDNIFELEEQLVNIYKEKYAGNNISTAKSNRQAALQQH